MEVWTAALSCEAILHALKQGAFYSTQGPRFESIAVEGSTIRAACSPVSQVRWRTWGSVGFVDYAPEGGCLLQSTLPEWFRPRVFVRIELVDDQGKRAWSNPFFVRSFDVDQ